MSTRIGSRGLSLVELLVALAIIAVLAALLFPVFQSARHATVRTDCRAHLKQIGMAYQLYLSDWALYPGPSPLSASIVDKRILYCADDVLEKPRGAASSYIFTARVPPGFTLISQHAEVHPAVVLTRCENHLQQAVRVGANDALHRSPPRHPFFMVLRAHGGVQEIPMSRKRTASLDGRWRVDLFPGEPGYPGD